MKRNTWIISAVAAAVAFGGYWLYAKNSKPEESPYRFVPVEKGDISALVSATGALNAVTTIEVGTQVSGRIDGLFADFNDKVTKGQLVARIDPTLQQQSVRDAEAGLERARAEFEQAELEYRRNLSLFDQKVLTEIEFNSAKYQRAVASASMKSAQVALDRARQNLSYTAIYAPIDGIVVERNVNVGQTVAASLSAPKLFMIANDLSRMQILASVDESDIGTIKEGQPVTFTVQAYPDEVFTGSVQKVRLQSVTTENVVNYTVVVEVANKGSKLLPGMTASVDFRIGEAKNVFKVANAALRFRPTEEMTAQLRERMAARRAAAQAAGESDGREGGPRSGSEGPSNPGSAIAGGAGPGNGGGAQGAGNRQRSANSAMLWYLDAEGKLATARVRTGLSDGQSTEISGRDLKEGMQVIAGVTQRTTPTSSSPFQPAAPAAGPRPGGGF